MTLRPQYHFRPTESGILIRSIPRLAKLLAGAPVISVPLADIRELDEPCWFAATGDTPTCRRIAEHMDQVDRTDLRFPIFLCAEGQVMDGMHRVVKALNLGHTRINAKRFVETPAWDFRDVPPDQLPY